jgi:hypothetical protein
MQIQYLRPTPALTFQIFHGLYLGLHHGAQLASVLAEYMYIV